MFPFTKKKAEKTFSYTPVLVPDGVPFLSTDPRTALLFQYNGISKEKAMQIPAVARGIHSMTSLAGLRMETFNKKNEKRANRLIDQVDPENPNIITMTSTIEDLVFEGVAIWEVTERAPNGYPVSARHVPKGQYSIQVTQLANGYVDYTYYLYGNKVQDNSNVIRIDSPRGALLPIMSSAVRQAIALQITAEGFARNPTPKMVVTSRGDTAPNREDVVKNLQAFKQERAENPIAYLGPDLEFKEIQLLSPQELQLIESDKSVTLAIANFFDMDPDQVGLGTNNETYNNAVDRRIDRRNNQLQWIAQAIEQRLSMPDITPRGYSVRFNFDEFLRVDPKTKAEIAQLEMSMGAATVTEYRMDTGRAPLTMEQIQEINMTKQISLPSVPEPPLKVQASLGTEQNFSADESIELDFDNSQNFARDVNTNSRTVTVLAVPYGQAAKSGGRKFEFAKGALEYADINRVKLLRDHDSTISVGYAIDAQDTDNGLVVTFKVPNGPAGDKALADFANKTHDGVSIGADFDSSDYTDHPTKPGVYLVNRAKLREVSQVAMPAFDDSRAMSVHMARETNNPIEGDIQMSDELKNETPDVGKLVAEAVAAAFAAQTSNNDETPIQDDAPALEVKKEKEVAVTFVNEEPAYRFDGSQGNYEFSTDIFAMNKGDEKARGRVQEFLRKEFAVSTSNASALNPTIQRPDMFVDLKAYDSPIWNAINKGTPPNGVSPFAWPKYNSSGTLVAAHTEGTEPTLGSYTVTNQTVTPTAISGKIEVNREAYDQGGNPQLSQLIRNRMHAAYAEALESYAVTKLEAETLTEVTLTTASVDDALVDGFVGTLIDLLTARGGNTMTDLFLNGTLYKALATAKDADNRYLLPAIGPANAVGTASNRFRGLDINGLVGSPAWALPTSATDNANSYLFDRADVSGWATAPVDLTFDVQVKSVYLAIWGYEAFAVTDATGVRRIKYDPAT